MNLVHGSFDSKKKPEKSDLDPNIQKLTALLEASFFDNKIETEQVIKSLSKFCKFQRCLNIFYMLSLVSILVLVVVELLTH